MSLDVDEIPLVGAHPALDLINTVERGGPPDSGPPHDFLSEPAALLRWTLRVGLISDAEADRAGRVWSDDAAAAHAGLAAVRDIRERLYVALLAADPHTSAPDGDVAAGAALVGLHERWAGAAARARLAVDESASPRVRLVYGTVPGMLVPDRIAESALDILLTADPTRIRRCPVPEGGCGWFFLDQSRNRSRRWCRMADCGNATKARRLTQRRRAARSGAE